MRILVTGAEGQVARALWERRGITPGFEVICVGRPQLDLNLPETVRNLVRDVSPDVIVSAAAYTAVDNAEDEPELARALNAVAPGVLASAASEIGSRIIHLSTDYVYDGRKFGAHVESDPTEPQTVYGRTKLDGEVAIRDLCDDHIILRTAWIYSPFGRNFVKTMIDLGATRELLTVVNDQHGNPTSAIDIADAILTILRQWRIQPQLGLGEVYHCAGTGAATWFEFARHTLNASRDLGGPFADVASISSAEWPTKAARPANSTLDCAKLARDFGWRSPQWQESVNVVVRRLVAICAKGPAHDQ